MKEEDGRLKEGKWVFCYWEMGLKKTTQSILKTLGINASMKTIALACCIDLREHRKDLAKISILLLDL